MKIYAIGDLHLSSNSNKPMDIFGWHNHKEKIFEDWKNKVKAEDLVLLAGDTSWALHLEEAKQDLEEIDKLPGIKVLIKGNHDYWWSTISKMNDLFEDMFFLHNNIYVFGNYLICGTRGWLCPNETKFTEDDQKIYEREALRFKNSLEKTKKIEDKTIIAMLHYPPTNENYENSLFTDLINEYKVDKVIYGHLHGSDFFKTGLQGKVDATEYSLVSCDYLDFKLKELF
jgi:hypothetical protein